MADTPEDRKNLAHQLDKALTAVEYASIFARDITGFGDLALIKCELRGLFHRALEAGTNDRGEGPDGPTAGSSEAQEKKH